MSRKNKFAVCLSLCFIFSYSSIKSQVKSGPMLGYNTMREVLIWVQTEKPQKVTLKWNAKDGNQKGEDSYTTTRASANTAHLMASPLEPGTTYQYSIHLDEEKESSSKGEFTTQSLWKYRSDPPNFSFSIGSCAYTNDPKYDRPGTPYGQDNEIFDHIAQNESEFMLWLGDNIYLREADWTSKTGIDYRYSHFKSMDKLQDLWKKMHHYAIWDDHDFGPNDADRSFVNKDMTLQAFKYFWGNPSYGINGKKGLTSMFSYNDADFFLMDNRYYRTPNHRKTGDRYILGDEQIDWLIDNLVNSKANFKFIAIGGQFVSDAAVYENHATFPEERQKIIDLIDKEGIKNVIFLNGDRHKTEMSKMTTANGIDIYEYTSSPLSSKAYNSVDEPNSLRVDGTHVATQNYGQLELKGPFKERELVMKCFDSSGKLLWEKTIVKQ